MNSNEQILTIRPGAAHAVCIATHDGLIRIERLTGDTRKFRITCPVGIRAEVGQDRLKENTAFIMDDDGRLIPAYDMLVPLVREDGSLIGAARPTMFQLVEIENNLPVVEAIPGASLKDVQQSLEGVV